MKRNPQETANFFNKIFFWFVFRTVYFSIFFSKEKEKNFSTCHNEEKDKNVFSSRKRRICFSERKRRFTFLRKKEKSRIVKLILCFLKKIFFETKQTLFWKEKRDPCLRKKESSLCEELGIYITHIAYFILCVHMCFIFFYNLYIFIYFLK